RHFDRLYQTVFQAAVASAGSTHSEMELGQEYSWYLRRNATAPRLATWLEHQRTRHDLALGSETYPNPLEYVRRLQKKRITAARGTVHGDVHPMNVLLDRHGVPHLIDFTWCVSQGHLLKDFLVMECSIRFLMMPKHLGAESRVILDEAFLDP